MRRRSSAGGTSVKPRGRKPRSVRRRSAPKTARSISPSVANKEIEVAQVVRERDDALEQLSAASEVLGVISSSPGDSKPVFDAILEKATRICEAKFGILLLCEGDAFRVGALHNVPSALADVLCRGPIRPGPNISFARAAQTKQPVQYADVTKEQGYIERDPLAIAAVELGGYRTILSVPMLKESEVIGVIVIFRQEVRPFTDKQIKLVQNFAAQAVIAIENARLLNELRESLQQQTATSEVLKVISSSPGELQPVFQAMLENATRICEAERGTLFRYDGEAFHTAALNRASSAYAEIRRQPIVACDLHPDVPLARVIGTKQTIHVADLREARCYIEHDPTITGFVEVAGARTLVTVPMLKENELIGAIAIYRKEIRPFTDKQIELLKNFAAQAVIAIENARLLNELRESLQQQTATSEVLSVISSSPGELQPVFQAMLENTVRISGAKYGLLLLYDGKQFRAAALHDLSPDYADALRAQPIPEARPGDGLFTLVETKQVVQIADIATEPAYAGHRLHALAGVRTLLIVPLLKENELIGAVGILRQEVRPFTDKQINLVQNFAAQAVIAIENARLLNELRQRTTDLTESLEQQTATSKVLEVISRSAFDLHAIFETVLESSVRLCGAKRAFIFRFDGELLRLATAWNASQEFKEFVERNPIRPGRHSVAARAALERRTIHILDAQTDPEFTYGAKDFEAVHTVLGVPILKGDELLGVIILDQFEGVRPFTDNQIALVETFADQAAIAIDNVRLLDELRQSLQQQTATADVLKVISRSTFDLRSVLQALVESAARFCAADNATVIREKDGLFYTAEAYGYSRGFLDYIRNTPIKTERGSASGRALVEGRVVHIPDVKADPEYTFVEAPRLGDFRTALCVPMLREDLPIGVLTLTRSEVKPFTDKQIELVTTFADQAAIAIENVRLFDEIQDKSRQLEEASQHKSQFLANMSHELRTPLNAILGYTELMADGAYGEPSEKMLGILKRLEANGKHLLGLINDVLDLSKIEAGQLVLELSDYCVQDIAQTVRSTLEPLASDKKLAFKLQLAPDLPPGHGDGRRLTQVLINLVGNAIKFTDAGEVAIKAEANNGSFCVSVRDTGPGISAADQAKLFQEFQQADNAITRKKGGTGLGLAISKRIIEMHGGRIWVESQPGQGSTFGFTLPVVVEQQINLESK